MCHQIQRSLTFVFSFILSFPSSQKQQEEGTGRSSRQEHEPSPEPSRSVFWCAVLQNQEESPGMQAQTPEKLTLNFSFCWCFCEGSAPNSKVEKHSTSLFCQAHRSGSMQSSQPMARREAKQRPPIS